MWRYRRCLVVGWLVASASLSGTIFVDAKDPYFPKHEFSPRPLSQLNATELSLINLDAPGHGAIYVMFMAVATIGLVLADVGADALVEQIASEHFPPRDSTGESVFVGDVTAKRIVGMLAAFVYLGLAMNGDEYGGDSTFTLKFNKVMIVISAVAFVPTVLAPLFIAENSIDRNSFLTLAQVVMKVCQNRGLNAIIACQFIAGIMRGVSATPGHPVAFYWATMQPVNDYAISFFAVIGVICVMRLAEKKGWALNHVMLIVVVHIVVLLLDCVITLATIWDVVRSQYLWLGMPLLETLPSVLEYVIIHELLSEIAEAGTADITREIIAAVTILASTVGVVLTKFIDAPFHVANEDILRDTDNVRTDTMTVFLIAYGAQLLSLAWMYVLPRRGDALLEWKMRHGTQAPGLGRVLIGVLTFGLVLSITVHVLSIIESTSCHRIAGGNGCN